MHIHIHTKKERKKIDPIVIAKQHCPKYLKRHFYSGSFRNLK